MFKLLAAAALSLLTSSACAKTIEVTDGGSIQAATDKAQVNDTILVRPGTYLSFVINLDWITVRSAVQTTGSPATPLPAIGVQTRIPRLENESSCPMTES